MTRTMAEALQRDLVDIFDSYEPPLQVTVGIVRHGREWGVGIRSQDADVDAMNTGPVTAS
jgi:hypothetical protein